MDSGTTHKREWYVKHFSIYRNRIINAMWYRKQGDPFDDQFFIEGYRDYNSNEQNRIATRSCDSLTMEEDFARHCLEYFLAKVPGRIEGITMTLHSFCEWYKGLYMQEGVLASVRNNMEADFLEQVNETLNFETESKYLRMASSPLVPSVPDSEKLWLNADIEEAEYMNMPSCNSSYLQGASFTERVRHEDGIIHALETIHLPEWTKDHQEEYDNNGYTNIRDVTPTYRWDVPGMRLPEKRFKNMCDLVAFDAKYHPYESPLLHIEESVSNPPAAEPQEKPTDATGATPETEPETVAKAMPGTGVEAVEGASLEALKAEPTKLDPLDTPKAEPEPYAYQEPWEKVALAGGLIRKPEQKERDIWNTLKDKDRKNKKELRYILQDPDNELVENVSLWYGYAFQNGTTGQGQMTLLYLYCSHECDKPPKKMALKGRTMIHNEIVQDFTINHGFTHGEKKHLQTK